MMKLKQFTVHEFRSVWDSGPISIDDQVTCLVGKNEAGKTALLTALYRTNPIIDADANFDEVYDYPKKEVEDYRFAVENDERKEAVVVECIYELDDIEAQKVSDVFGKKAVTTKSFKRLTYYGKRNSQFNLSADDAAAQAHLASNSEFPEALSSELKQAEDWDHFASSSMPLKLRKR